MVFTPASGTLGPQLSVRLKMYLRRYPFVRLLAILVLGGLIIGTVRSLSGITGNSDENSLIEEIKKTSKTAKIVEPLQHNPDAENADHESLLEKSAKWLTPGSKAPGRSHCPNYEEYSSKPHLPFTKTKLRLSYMRPDPECRTFHSDKVESTIEEMKQRMKDPDLVRLFENCFPNTLDTTILWSDFSDPEDLQTFIVTGDIPAEWLRDAARQLSVYHGLAVDDEQLALLLEGAINTQAQYITRNPYCNAFHPPKRSKLNKPHTDTTDRVIPVPDWTQVFECKWELDSLASFLLLSNEYYKHTGSTKFINYNWIQAFKMILYVIEQQRKPTFDPISGMLLRPEYIFQRNTNIGTETLALAGAGNPVNSGTGLIRSAFRPSDDATIFQFFIPANAFMAVELNNTYEMLTSIKHVEFSDPVKEERLLSSTGFKSLDDLVMNLAQTGKSISEEVTRGIFEHGVVRHPRFGEIFAYEVDGFGGQTIMDDANLPSLLSLPVVGFVDKDNEIYNNTRAAILSKEGNPYFLRGRTFSGIGGPHIGLLNGWPMSLIYEIRTSDSDEEIMDILTLLKSTTSRLGLMHESVQVNSFFGSYYTRPWFAWCNSEFAAMILDLAERKPHLLFGDASEGKDGEAETGKLGYQVDNVNA